MDIGGLKQRIHAAITKYRYAALVLLLGILLMTIPVKSPTSKETVQVEEKPPMQMEARLSLTLSQIEGAGKVTVLLTESEGEHIHYQSNESMQGETYRSDTVTITDSSRTQQGLISQIDPPKYLGAVIICQGAKNAAVRLAITEAVANATGLSYDHISVLKMK